MDVVETEVEIRRLGVVAFLDDENVVPGAKRADRFDQIGHLALGLHDLDFRVIEMLQHRPREPHGGAAVGRAAEIRPEGRLHVLDHVQPAVREQRKQHVEAGDHMRRNMAAVVDDDVERAVLGRHARQERGVVLRALTHGDPRTEIQRLGEDVDSQDAPVRKVIGPHGERGAAEPGELVSADADLEQAHRPVAQVREQLVIDRRVEVGAPLVGAVPDRNPRQRIDVLARSAGSRMVGPAVRYLTNL